MDRSEKLSRTKRSIFGLAVNENLSADKIKVRLELDVHKKNSVISGNEYIKCAK